MRVCDKCGKQPVVDIWTSYKDGTEVDLCSECNIKLKDFLSKKENEREDKRTNRDTRKNKN